MHPAAAANRRPQCVLVLCGPTGVGKTEVAVALAKKHGLDLVSADSRQVYTWLDIGTAKPGSEVRRQVQFHMIDMVEPNRVYSAADFARDALAVMRRLVTEGKRFLVVGGAGLYVRALFQPFFEAPRPDASLRKRLEGESSSVLHERLRTMDPERASQLHPNDRQRIMRALEVRELTGKTMSELTRCSRRECEFEPEYAALNLRRDELHRRLDARFDTMMKAGLLDEVRSLSEAGFGRDTYVANAYGYAELLAHLEGEMSLGDAVSEAKAKTRAYARRQLAWFRALPDVHWFDFTTVEDTALRVEPLLLDTLSPSGSRKPK